MWPHILILFAALLAAQPDKLALESRRAKAMMSAGRFEEAIPIYRRLAHEVPGNPGLLLDLALAQHLAGREREAVPNLEAVLRMQPRSIPALIALGAARLALNQPQQAAERYRQLTELSADDPQGWYGLGASYQAIATDAFERLRGADPQSPYVAALVADTRVQQRQYGSASFFYREALKRLPNLHGIHAALADLDRKTGHADWAAAEDAKERDLPAADCRAHPSECQFIGGHDLQAAIPPRGSAPSPEALFWQAKAANELALQAFFRLGQLPPSMELHRLRAEIARNHNRHLEAATEWRAALELSPGNPGVERELAVSLFLARDYRAAADEAAVALKASPRSSELNFVLGDSFLRLEEPEKAVAYLRAALAADPKLLAADASLGLSLSRLGDNAEAIPHLERALALDDDGNLHYQLARAYQAAGESAKARAAMTQYQEILARNREEKEKAARDVP